MWVAPSSALPAAFETLAWQYERTMATTHLALTSRMHHASASAAYGRLPYGVKQES